MNAVAQVVDLVGGQREALCRVRAFQRARARRQGCRSSRAAAGRPWSNSVRRIIQTNSTLSTIRSCRSARSATARSLGCRQARPRSSAMPRSTRRTAVEPALWAMSVALLDQGERVPGRGTTRNSRLARRPRRGGDRTRAGDRARRAHAGPGLARDRRSARTAR